MTWNPVQTTSYNKFNLLKAPEIIHFYQSYLGPICRGKNVLDIGCGDGGLKKIINHRNWINVDPYTSNTDLVIKRDAIAYMKDVKKSSFGVIICCFAIHHFITTDFRRILVNCLEKHGQFINFSISPRSTLFGDIEFNRKFFMKGFSRVDTLIRPDTHSTISIDIAISYNSFYKFIQRRSWSNLTITSDTEIDYLLSRIPKGLKKISLTIDILKIQK